MASPREIAGDMSSTASESGSGATSMPHPEFGPSMPPLIGPTKENRKIYKEFVSVSNFAESDVSSQTYNQRNQVLASRKAALHLCGPLHRAAAGGTKMWDSVVSTWLDPAATILSNELNTLPDSATPASTSAERRSAVDSAFTELERRIGSLEGLIKDLNSKIEETRNGRVKWVWKAGTETFEVLEPVAPGGEKESGNGPIRSPGSE